MPACCWPLNGVMTGDVAPGSQPRLNGFSGLLNHSPRWYWWVGENVTVPPAETENVSTLNTPLTVPLLPVWTSVWYHATPNGLFGSWMTNRSKPVFAGRPLTETVIVSLGDPGVIVAVPLALGRHAVMPGEGTRLNENEPAWVLVVAPDAAVRPTVSARPLAAAVIGSTRRRNRLRVPTGPLGNLARLATRLTRDVGSMDLISLP